MTVSETVDIVATQEFIAIQHILDHMEGKQSHYFLISLGEDSWGILKIIPCVRMIIENCITATKFKPDHYKILLCCHSPTRTP